MTMPSDTPTQSPQTDRAHRLYTAFLSYSHRDKDEAAWLHRKLEAYKAPDGVAIPQDLPVRNGRLAPVFRDREELSTSHDLNGAIVEALTHASTLIVLCSPASAESHWVNEEVKAFKSLHGEERVFALIVKGDENGDPVFPPALLQRIGPDGAVLDGVVEHIAADMRADKDGKNLAFLKIAAGLLATPLDELRQRDHQRERRLWQARTAAALGLALFSGALAYFAFDQRDEARTQRAEADRQRDIAALQSDNATAALDFMVSLFEIANPATENPNTITAVTVLERGHQKIDAELGDKPAIRAKLMNAIGSAFHQLGDVKESIPILANAAEGPFVSIEDEVDAKMDYANVLIRSGEFDQAEEYLRTVNEEIEARIAEKNRNNIDISNIRHLIKENYALLYYKTDRVELAVDEYNAARELCVKSEFCDQVKYAILSSNISTMLNAIKKPNDAKLELVKARETFRRVLGDKHIHTAVTTHNLAFTEFNSGNVSLALQYMREADLAYGALLDENHPTRGISSMLMGRIFAANGDAESAVGALKKSRRIFQQVYGSENKQIGNASIYLALALADAGRRSEALAAIDEAQSVYSKIYPENYIQFGDLEVQKAIALSKLGDEDAVAVCQNGISMMHSATNANDQWSNAMQNECIAIEAKFASNVH